MYKTTFFLLLACTFNHITHLSSHPSFYAHAGTNSVNSVQRRIIAITVEIILTDLLRIVHESSAKVVHRLFIKFRIVWGEMEIGEKNYQLAEVQANYALSLTNSLIDLSGDNDLTPRIGPHILLGDMYVASKVQPNDSHGGVKIYPYILTLLNFCVCQSEILI